MASERTIRLLRRGTTCLLLVFLAAAATAAAQTGQEAPAPAAPAAPQDKVCQLCHQEIKTARAVKEATLHKGVACVDCHAALKSFDPSGDEHEKPGPVDCSGCHAQQAQAVAASVHAEPAGACNRCHAPHSVGLARKGEAERALLPGDGGACATCHAAAANEWRKSPHAGDPGNGRAAALCTDCHGSHEIRKAKDPQSKVFPLQLPDTCEACHRPDPSPAHPAPAGNKVRQYETSVHGRGLRVEGLVVTATCASCHGSHSIRKVADADAATSRKNIPATCGACHAGILRTYREGVHGRDFVAGGKDVPVCTDCHREHAIADPARAGSSVSAKVVAETCARCHANDDLGRKYGFKSSTQDTWGSSYHGIASAFGTAAAANCASCHGFHDILPPSDARSPVNAKNLAATCGRCHEHASAAFAKIPVHSIVDAASNPVPYWIKVVYTTVVVGVIGGFVLLIVIDLFGRLRLKLRLGPPETHHVDPREWPDEDRLVAPGESFLRMGRAGRIQHAILILAFVLLVLTGIPVFLHQVPWMRGVIDAEGGFLLRSRLHRVGALALIGLSAWHFLVVALHPAARRWFAQMVFRPRDFTDFFQDVMFSLGVPALLMKSRRYAALAERHPWLRFDRRPRIGRFGLVEKLEYGAVLWGNFVMILTGLILWRPDWFLGWTPKWTFEVCRVVHGFEATLAFLAIVIWHMYHVHLRPGNFPMSRVFINGRITRKELRHHHPEEYLALLERRRGEAIRADPGAVPPESAAPHAVERSDA